MRYLPFSLLSLLLALCAGMAWSAEVKNPTISYTLPKDARVSIAIYDKDGGIVRQLVLGAPRKAGPNVEEWDGLDEAGKPMPAGQYSWKMLTSQGLKAEWMTSLGTNLTPGYAIMPGNHVGAITAAVDEKGDIYIMGGCSECVPGMAKVTLEGVRLWASDHLVEANNNGGCGVAGGLMFSLLSTGHLIAIDPATGTGKWKVQTNLGDPNSPWNGGSWLQLTAHGDQIVVASTRDNKIYWFSPKDGSRLDEAPVLNPKAVALDSAGNVWAISGASVVKLSRAAKAPQTVITNLIDPLRLAVDPNNGIITVAEGGDGLQIKRFASDGKLLATLGRKGGRLFGKYNPADFRGVTGLTANNTGGFIVIEGNAAPRRVATFDANGKLVREWYGGLHYANGGSIDPDDASLVWAHWGSGEVVQAKVDYIKKTYKVLATYKLIGIGDGIISSGNSMDIFMVRHFKGHTYLISQCIEPRMALVDEANRRLVPLVAGKYFMMHDFNNATYTPLPLVKAYFGGELPAGGAKYGATTDAKNKEACIWTDLNGDMKVQTEEVIFSPRMLQTWSCGRVWADSQMNLYEMNDKPMVWRPKGWTQGGAPIYGGWADWQPLGEKPKWFDPLKVSWPAGSGVVPLPDGSMLGFFNNTENPFGKGIGSESLGGNYIVKWDKSGKLVWYTGRHSPNFDAAPGEGRFFWNIAGLAHNCVVVTDMQCYFIKKNLVYVWDPDGLWVGRLFDEPDLKAAPEEAYNLATENFGGTLVEITKKNKAPGLNVGDVLFAGCGQNVTALYKITGWDSMKKSAGTIALSPEQAELAKTNSFAAIAAKGSSGKLSHMKKYVSSTLPRLTAVPVLDGKLDDAAWQKAGLVDDFRMTPAEEDPEKQQTAVMVGYDDTNLYFGVRCKEPNLDKLKAFGSPIHLDDSVEIFVDRECDRQHYYQFIINPNAVYYVGYGWSPKPDVKIDVKSGREKDAWTLEVAIPWANIGAKAPAVGEKLGFNVVRNHFAGVSESSNWSPLRGNLNHTPGYFGTLYVGDTLPRDAVALKAGHAFIRDMNKTGVTVDGAIAEWKNVTPLKIYDGAKPLADVYLGWKTDGLYVAFDVTTDKPWKNASALDMAFNGGASCDLNIGPIIKDQKKAAEGDVRFLAAPLGGKDEVVEFLTKLTEDLTEADRAPRKYHTDAQGDNNFDRLALLPAGSCVTKVKPEGKGYIVEMRVPLRAPLKLESGQRFKLDASVILSNNAGNRAELRLPWFSTSGDDMFVATDVVMETTLRPWNWGEAELE